MLKSKIRIKIKSHICASQYLDGHREIVIKMSVMQKSKKNTKQKRNVQRKEKR